MKPKIIVVEDEVLIAMQIQSILEAEGYEVKINIYSVENALEHLKHETPDLVLIDINLQKNQDGVDLARILHQRGTVPFIFITSYANKTTVDRVNATRPYGYIVKPFKPLDLLANVSMAINNFKHRKIDTNYNEKETIHDIPLTIRKIVNYINDNIDKKIEVADLIDLTSWQSRQFSRLFFTYLNATPYQYILNRKIEKANALIQDTKIPLNQIAFELGFSSYSNFCRAFKKIMDKKPDHFRKNI